MPDQLMAILNSQTAKQAPSGGQDPLLAILNGNAQAPSQAQPLPSPFVLDQQSSTPPVQSNANATINLPALPTASDSLGDRFARGYLNFKEQATTIPYAGRAIRGFLDIPEGVTQLAAHGLNSLGIVSDKDLSDYEAARNHAEQVYQQNRQANTPQTLSSLVTGQKVDPGYDWGRLAGNVLPTLPLLPLQAAGAAGGTGAATVPMLTQIGQGAKLGALTAAANPVNTSDPNSSYWLDKTGNTVLSGLLGGALPLVGSGVKSLLSPAAATNPELALLNQGGVRPTIGQTLGGMANSVEEKLSSLPIVGDAISAARRNALNQWNNLAINRAVAPIGGQVEGTGSSAIAKAGDMLSNAYNTALNSITGVQLDPQFSAQLSQLHGMAQNLVPKMRDKFNSVVQDTLLSRVSPNGGMLPETYKAVDSELGNMASKYGKSAVASESDFGDAVGQLQSLLNQQMRRSNPQIADQLGNIDQGWANLVRVENAGTAAANNNGVFTPAQLMNAIKATEDTVRKRGVARGTALMQDVATAGQNVLSNKVPNSFTADRAGQAMLALGASGAWNPMAPVGLLGGASLYTPPAQWLINKAVTARPAAAAPIGNAVQQYAPALAPAAFGFLQQVRQGQ